ncbi:helix-turn-helix domain-containing protein [Nonomuraea sp. ATR24]|uniref:helix-turn-helix domain-containing protein n=2 Tax=Nonomuraea TaxID=83681 RepID=UPI0035BF8870
MVSVRSHLRRLRSGKTVRVRAHTRRGSAAVAPAPVVGSDAGMSGVFLLVLLLLFLGLLSGGVTALVNSSPVASETNKKSQSAPPEPSRLPEGPEGRLAAQLRDIREKAGLSREEAAAQSGIAEATINDFEHALAVPSAQTLKALSSVYEMSFDEWTMLEIARAELH